ncbi:hypothetical protein, conserved [Trypanosoma brucei brucei TREU927]|uniref:Enriched in surface-labeled proteome protein 13 n=1 Tax=Trypanosoma brucei brucei (strain 927/4 GUTat10.1) TaxID=185431 RepID=Q57UQ6_TRYB2|nr:hypothetical protein, conserved [Trypanosoma brucei brucei TREU927]AAX70663.1 hypothetical protein, conserved [Trypanosoma brucei]AAZ12490.1 hypothetical protein, conserved [Trypanosoma brucei brucei TREU927]
MTVKVSFSLTTAAMLLLIPMPTLSKNCFATPRDNNSTDEEQLGTSKHVITFSGDKWGGVYTGGERKLKTALLLDIYAQILRRHAFDTTADINDVNTRGKHMSVTVTITQVLINGTPSEKMQHTWNPSEISSLLMQGTYKHTNNLYNEYGGNSETGSNGAVRLLSVKNPTISEKLHRCGEGCAALRTFSGVILFFMALVSAICVFLIFKWRRDAEKEEDEEEEEEDIPTPNKHAVNVLNVDDARMETESNEGISDSNSADNNPK